MNTATQPLALFAQ